MDAILSIFWAPLKVLLGILGWVAIIVGVGLLHRLIRKTWIFPRR